ELDGLPFDSLQAAGLNLERTDIFDPDTTDIADAVVQLRGATGSFVSNQGLIITNHHVAFGSVQKASTLENNYVRDGFYAPTPRDEIIAPGMRAYVTLNHEDVTDRVLGDIPNDLPALERQHLIRDRIKAITAETEAGRDVRCNVASIHDGRRYVLYTRFMIRDVRLVYVPPRSIGEFGGEIDNWMWPRHTGDFAFMRAYVAPDGSAATYSADNVPYEPKIFLPISSKGIVEGDFTMLIGFPGSTDRYLSAAAADYTVNTYYPLRIELYQRAYDLVQTEMQQDPEKAIRLESFLQSVSNRLKNSYGIAAGFGDVDYLGHRQKVDQQLQAYLGANPDADKRFGHMLAGLDSLYAAKSETLHKDLYLYWLLRTSDYFSQAAQIHKWVIEQEKPDEERRPGYQDRDSSLFRYKVREAQINLVESADKLFFREFVERLLSLPANQIPKAVSDLTIGVTDTALTEHLTQITNAMFAASRMDSLAFRLGLMDKSAADIEAVDDPIIQFAVAMRDELDARLDRDDAFKGELGRLQPTYVSALSEMTGDYLYPDANSTKRINFGRVEGYQPRDAVYYHYLTTLTGVMEKETDQFPFTVPAELKAAYERGDFGPYVDTIAGDVPVCFLAINDATGGNSGSPLLNGDGEIIGLDFDRNIETVVADYYYESRRGRSIIVDSRYVLFVIDQVYGLDGLLQELTIH
ncbi:hypothetical protein GF377_05590, partial [candidate division GN15 bacterium]|nr:hypothetical protein [candidate division GN15 bacterium]